MSLSDMELDNLNKRISAIEKVDLDERLTYIEKQLNQCIYACKEISESFKNGIQVSFSQASLNLSEQLNGAMSVLKQETSYLVEAREEMKKYMKKDSITQTLQFMAKRIHELSEEMKVIKLEGLKKEIHLALTCDGYEMVKKKVKNFDDIPEQEESSEDVLESLLATLEDRERTILIHRFGLFGIKIKTCDFIGKMLGVDRQRISVLTQKVLTKCRGSGRAHLVKKLTHIGLRRAIIGE